MQDQNAEISDQELLLVIAEIKQNIPYFGVQMICGSLRDKGIRVLETVCVMLFGCWIRCTELAITTRHPYSVAGPNSLWHIGKCNYNCNNLAGSPLSK